MPYSPEEIEQFVLGLIEERRQILAGEGTATSVRLKQFGGSVFDAVVQGPVRDCYYRSRDASTREGRGLRIKLRLGDVPNLGDVPWEFLYDRSTNQFLALSDFSPIVRHLGLPGPVTPLAVKPPLRILAVIASPKVTTFAELESDAEWTRLSTALSRLVQAGKVQLELLKPGTLGELQRRLRRGEYHVLHFIGHGGFDAASGLGMLVFEDDDGRDHLVEGERFANVVCDHRSLRLAFLNCCEGTRASTTSPFTGVAQALLQKGVPAVVAMQFDVTDVAALALGETFYEALADGCEVDMALAETRKALYASANEVEWATPVLYLQSQDGRLFDIAGVAPAGAAARSAYIETNEPVDGTTRFPLTGAPVTVGRAVGNDIALPNDEVSRWHAVFEPAGDRWRVRDLASRNGTLVNGVPVAEWTLRPGDDVQIGRFHLVFAVDRGMVEGDTTRAAAAAPDLDLVERAVLLTLARSVAADADVEAGSDRAIAQKLDMDVDDVKRRIHDLFEKFDIAPGRGRRTRLVNEAAMRRAFGAWELRDHDGDDE
jgi:hypothetical protein